MVQKKHTKTKRKKKEEEKEFSGGSLTTLYRYRVDGCTGTRVDGCTGTGACTGTEPLSPATRASGLDFVDLVPVQGPVYRYKAADFVQFETAGAFSRLAVGARLIGLEPSLGLDWKDSSSPLELRIGSLLIR
uniref:Uncharacterized protein n=1 Tax=Ananas comosus var. bracteatus TaxID=296719 RepID=A0A6V7QC10_ANACO|nr:unnamed protein product [Ananas comosus var. bracteatus]